MSAASAAGNRPVDDPAIGELAEALMTGADSAEVVRLAGAVLDRALAEAAWEADR